MFNPPHPRRSVPLWGPNPTLTLSWPGPQGVGPQFAAKWEGLRTSLATTPALKAALSQNPKQAQETLVETLGTVGTKFLMVLRAPSSLFFVCALDPRQRDAMPK